MRNWNAKDINKNSSFKLIDRQRNLDPRFSSIKICQAYVHQRRSVRIKKYRASERSEMAGSTIQESRLSCFLLPGKSGFLRSSQFFPSQLSLSRINSAVAFHRQTFPSSYSLLIDASLRTTHRERKSPGLGPPSNYPNSTHPTITNNSPISPESLCSQLTDRQSISFDTISNIFNISVTLVATCKNLTYK